MKDYENGYIIWGLRNWDYRKIILEEIKVILVTTIENIYKFEMYIFESNYRVYVAISYGIHYYKIFGKKQRVHVTIIY